MAKAKRETDEFDIDEFSDQMIEKMNEMLGNKMVHNLGLDENPAKVCRWYSTNCRLLDWVISGRSDGGFPGGRFCEVSGRESIGKSQIAYQVAKAVQDAGGICCYADTEEASSIENLKRLGVNVSKRFQYAKPNSIEDTFHVAETFLKLVDGLSKKPPLLFVYDSVGGVGSEHEKSMNFNDPQRPGANAKTISFGLRKIRSALGKNDVLCLLINQVYDIIGATMYEAQTKTKGGLGIRYDCSVRVELKACGQVFPEEMTPQDARAKGLSPIGIKVRATTIKNKVAAPFRSVEFEIIFGVGLKCHNQMWEMLTNQKDKETIMTDGNIFRVLSDNQWKEFGVFDKITGEQLTSSGKFRKREIEMKLLEYKNITDKAIDAIMAKIMDPLNKNSAAFDPNIIEKFELEEDDLLSDM